MIRSVTFDFFQIRNYRVNDMDITAEWDSERLCNYLTTWSGYQSFMRQNPESQILAKMHEE